MKKLFLFIMTATIGLSVCADMTLEQFLAKRKARAERKGKTFNQAKEQKRFSRMDTDNNGLLSRAEQTAYSANKQK